MKHMNSRRILAMLLALCMMVGMLSMTAFATDAKNSSENSGEAYVTVTGSEEHHSTLTEAVKAASVDADGTVTYTIYGKVNAGSTETWIPILKSGLENVSTVKFVAGDESAELLIENKTSILAVNTDDYDVDVSFENLKLSHTPNEQTISDIGHGVRYFTCWLRNKNANENTVTYTNCEFPNGACNNQYGKTVYDGCKFTNTSDSTYNLWNYGGTTTVRNNSEFTGGRGIKVYNEGKNGGTVEVANTSFNLNGSKAAVVVSTLATVKMSDVTVESSMKTGLIAKELDSNLGFTQTNKETLAVTGSGISGTFTMQDAADKTTEEYNITAGSFAPVANEGATLPDLTNYLADGCTVDESGTVTGSSSETAVAIVGATSYGKLEDAFAALDETNHTLMLTENGKTKWDSAKPVYWAVGEGNYTAAATLAEALKAAYTSNIDGKNITVVCRPYASVGKMSHAHVTDNLVIYGNSAYVEIGGDQDIEVDTYAYSRSTGAQVANNAAKSNDYLDKDITINLYEIDNLSVWGERHTEHTVTINMTGCETKLGEAAKGSHRIYISGITGENNISLKNCKFASVPTAIYTNANGSVSVDSCEFNNAALAVNLNHKAAGTQNVDIKNCTFNGCGNADEWKAFAAPVRFVQSVEGGTQTATVDSCSFSETAGNNGDILLGDGRTGEESHDVSLTLSNAKSVTNVVAQKPNYYGADGNVANIDSAASKKVEPNGTLNVISSEMLGNTTTTNVAKITRDGADVGTYATLAEAFAAAADGDTITLLSDCSGNGIVVKANTFMKSGLTVDFGKHTYTVGGVLVGSATTGTNAFQLNAGNKIAFKNGGIVGVAENTKPAEDTPNWHGAPAIVIQNYCDLTLDSMTITGGDETVYTMSNNCGNITINNTTINAGKAKDYTRPAFAFDVYGGWYEDDVTVTVTGSSVINGNIEIERDTAKNSKNTLKLEGCTVNGTLKIGDGAVNNDKAMVTKTNATILENEVAGHKWVDGKLTLDEKYVARIGTDKYFETLEAAVAGAADGDTILLLKDSSGNGIKVEANKFATGLTVDFGGHTYTFNGKPVGSTGSETQAAHFESGNKITLKNGKFDAAAGQTNLKILVQNYCDTLTLDNMTLDGTNVFKSFEDLLTLSNNNGMVTIKDTMIIAPERVQGASSNKYAFDICGFQEYAGVTVIVTGSANGTSTINGNIKLSTNDKEHDLVLTLDKGTVNGKLVSIDGAVEKVKISKKADFIVDAPAGYKWNETGTELVKDETVYVAQIGKAKYTSLQEAVDAITVDGGAIYLLANISLDDTVKISDKGSNTGKELKIYLSSHYINGADGKAVFDVENSNIKIMGGSTSGIKGNNGVAIRAGTGAVVKINGGNYSGGDSAVCVTGAGKVEILEGRFSSLASSDGKYHVLDKADDATGSITVKYEKAAFVNYNPQNDGKITVNSSLVFNATVEDGNTVYTSVKKSTATYNVLDAEGNVVKAYGAGDAIVADMIQNLENGQTVRLLKNATANITIPAGKDFTLDLNGKTLTNNGEDTITVEAGAKLTIMDNVGGGTVDNVTHGKAAIVNKGEVVLSGGTYTRSTEDPNNDKYSAGTNSYYTIANYGTMTINEGVTVKNVGHYSSMIRNGGVETNECCLTINGGTFDGGINTVKNDVMGALTINDGSFSNTTQFVVMNWNKTEIKGGTFAPTADAEAILFSAYIDKDCAVGKLTISGGMFTAQANTKLIEENYYNVDGSIAYTGTAAVSGGTFNKPVDQKFCADGYEPNKINDTEYGVKPAEGNVKLIGADGNVRYGSIADAENGETIQLYKDITVGGVFLRSNKTLDLNGHKLTTDYVMATAAQVIDSTEGQGLLVIADKDYLSLNQKNNALPLLDNDAGGYRLFTYALEVLREYHPDGDTNTAGFYFTLKLGSKLGYELLAKLTDDSGLNTYIPVQINSGNWQDVRVPLSALCDFASAVLRKPDYNDSTYKLCNYHVTFTGLSNFATGTTIKATTLMRTLAGTCSEISTPLVYEK